MSDDQEFFLRLGRIGDRGTGNLARSRSFVSEVLAASRKSGLGAIDLKSRGGFRRSGRGRDAGLQAGLSNRRVIIKARVVRHGGARYRAAPLANHMRYLRREGVTRDGAPAEMFDRDGPADHDAFARRCDGDRHHFRFIVSPEDAGALADLKATTRELMAQAEKDLGTRLDWVAADHWNTEHPHIHVLVRGVDEAGQDLVIDRDYIANGMRRRAEALVSLELGPRTPAEVAASLEKDVEAERWTSLDRQLRERRGPNGLVDLRPDGQGEHQAPSRLIGRARFLQKLGLADGVDGQWRLDDDLEGRLRGLGERGDIIKTLHRAWRGERDPADLRIQGVDLDASIIGRLADRGLHDELNGQAYVVVDGVDGRLHHVRLRDLAEAGDTPIGGLIEIRARALDNGKRGLELVHRADLSIERQVTAIGATWLDRQLVVKDPAPLAGHGFGREVREALEARRTHLQDLGLADRLGRPRPGLLATLRKQELARIAENIAGAEQIAAGTAKPGDTVQGVYQRRIDLASGRFAMVDDGLGFQLVPWTRALDERLGQTVKGTMTPGGWVDWAIGRKRGRGL
jgi:type IV secretory pathway VirD2 relaxase